jgi:hypothetical protein
LSEEADQELGIPGGKIELEDGFLDEGLNRPDGIFLQDAGNPFDGAAQVFSIRQQVMHDVSTSSRILPHTGTLQGNFTVSI